jgi:hypothetical protein
MRHRPQPRLSSNINKINHGTIRPLGIACNINVKISRKCIPTNFFVIDSYHCNHDHIILGIPFLTLVDAVLDAGKGKVTMNLNGKKYTYNFLRVSKHSTPLPPEDEVEEVDSLCFVGTLRDLLQRAMENQVNDQQDEELEEATKGLEPQDGRVEEEKFEDIGEIKPEEPQVPEVDLKPLPKGLKYEFLGLDKTYPVIVSDKWWRRRGIPTAGMELRRCRGGGPGGAASGRSAAPGRCAAGRGGCWRDRARQRRETAMHACRGGAARRRGDAAATTTEER